MNRPELLLARLEAIAGVLARRDSALALLALGSVGVERGRLDEYSDLDFFVVVREGAKAAYLASLAWMAEAHPIAWAFQNTRDGHKLLYADGVFCEYAMFEPGEMAEAHHPGGGSCGSGRDLMGRCVCRVTGRPLPHRPRWSGSWARR